MFRPAYRAEACVHFGSDFEYAANGQPFDPPAVRKARLAEAVQVLHPLLRGEEVTFSGAHL
jgi:alkanesulfonate monooxygenase SsuD/methylene tetrahydromethanopterin reductase-like flavin-dependent oxidoreductase (luciferase family)